jgi:hypothetical protein
MVVPVWWLLCPLASAAWTAGVGVVPFAATKKKKKKKVGQEKKEEVVDRDELQCYTSCTTGGHQG